MLMVRIMVSSKPTVVSAGIDWAITLPFSTVALYASVP